MIEAATRDFAIDMNGSWMIGDKKIDVETGKKAGTKTAMVMTGYGLSHVKQLEDVTPDVLADDLLAAVREALR
jgi:D-glycero-D-manno-heptose 1,7-bisphosphate phosphatase